MPDEPIPRTLEECFAVLELSFTEEELRAFRDTPRRDLGRHHFGLGMGIRNEWGLWRGGPLSDDLRRRGCCHPDIMSTYILEHFHDRLNGRSLRTSAQTLEGGVEDHDREEKGEA